MPLILIILLFLSGCSSYSGPKESVTISNTTELHNLSGLYNNSGSPAGYLSQFIWGNTPINANHYRTYLKHYKIQYIQVTPQNNSVFVRAIVNDCVAHEMKYVQDTDFEIVNGQIVLSTDGDLLSRGAGDPLVGPSSQQVTMSLDVNGNGVYKNETVAAGLVFLIVPVAISDVTEIRFKKQSDNKSYNYCISR